VGDDPKRSSPFSRLGEQLTGLLDPEGAFRRGQGIVSGVTQATKEEFMRLFAAEVRAFLQKIDATDLVQEVITGLVLDVKMQVRFSKAEDGKVAPQVSVERTEIRTEADDPKPASERPATKPRPR
jgi:hypothetical protein